MDWDMDLYLVNLNMGWASFNVPIFMLIFAKEKWINSKLNNNVP